MSIEAMKQALEALEDCYSTGGDNGQPLYQFYDDGLVKTAITALRTAIEAAEKQSAERGEPVAWIGLTDEEVQWIYDNGRTPAGMIDMAEAKLREKNA